MKPIYIFECGCRSTDFYKRNKMVCREHRKPRIATERQCIVCGAVMISTTAAHPKVCPECRPEYRREQQKAYSTRPYRKTPNRKAKSMPLKKHPLHRTCQNTIGDGGQVCGRRISLKSGNYFHCDECRRKLEGGVDPSPVHLNLPGWKTQVNEGEFISRYI